MTPTAAVLERIETVLGENDLSARGFCRLCGITESQLSTIKARGGGITWDVLDPMVRQSDRMGYSPLWVLFGLLPKRRVADPVIRIGRGSESVVVKPVRKRRTK